MALPQAKPLLTTGRLSLVIGIAILLTSWDPALAQQTRKRTATGSSGRSLTTTRQVTPTGNGTFTQSGTFTRIDPHNRSVSGSFSGSGSRSWSPDQGLTRTSTGEVTTSKDRSILIDRNHTTTVVEGEGLQRTGDTTITNAEGEVLGTSTNTSTLDAAGVESSTILTGRTGQSARVDSVVTPESDSRFLRSTTVSNSAGDPLGGAATTIDYERTPGQGWTKQITGTTNSGQAIDRTVTNEPLEEDGL